MAVGSTGRRKSAERGLGVEAKRLVALWVQLFREHELLTYASAIARTTIVASVGLVLLLLGLLGAIGREDVWFAHVAPQFQQRLLPHVYGGVDETVKHVFSANSAGLIVFATLLSIWEVSGSVRATSGALNRIYESEETRP